MRSTIETDNSDHAASDHTGSVRATSGRVASAHPREPLTDREKQILRLLCDGLTNAQIATRMGVSAELVKSGLRRIFRKIDVKNRTQAAVLVVHDRI